MRKKASSAALDIETKAEPVVPAAGRAPSAEALETVAPGMPKLTAMMALGEPDRTAALEHAVASGEAFYLRSKTGEDVRVRYGNHILVVPPSAKPFTAAHAIHVLWTVAELVEEVEE